MSLALEQSAYASVKPRLGFAGLGWIGGQRMQVLAASGSAEVAALCEPVDARVRDACRVLQHPPAVCGGFDELIAQPLDGIVIATPNALHEEQAAAALERGIAVFVQKPLALSRAGTERLVALAKRRDLPLGVDWSYRWLEGMPELKRRLDAGEIGAITAAELCFHNAYGPDAAWYYDIERSGGGCLLDLGCHLLDLCHWLLGARDPVDVRARCFRDGRPLHAPVAEPEDFAVADIDYANGPQVHLACSWRASVGRGAVIGCRVFGTEGGAGLRNVDGSFHDFEITLNRGDKFELLGAPPDPWPGRALLDWASRLRDSAGVGDDLAPLAMTAELIDRIYGRTPEAN